MRGAGDTGTEGDFAIQQEDDEMTKTTDDDRAPEKDRKPDLAHTELRPARDAKKDEKAARKPQIPEDDEFLDDLFNDMPV